MGLACVNVIESAKLIKNETINNTLVVFFIESKLLSVTKNFVMRSITIHYCFREVICIAATPLMRPNILVWPPGDRIRQVPLYLNYRAAQSRAACFAACTAVAEKRAVVEEMKRERCKYNKQSISICPCSYTVTHSKNSLS